MVPSECSANLTLHGWSRGRFWDACSALQIKGFGVPRSRLLGKALESLGQRNGPQWDMRMTGFVLTGLGRELSAPKSQRFLRFAIAMPIADPRNRAISETGESNAAFKSAMESR